MNRGAVNSGLSLSIVSDVFIGGPNQPVRLHHRDAIHTCIGQLISASVSTNKCSRDSLFAFHRTSLFSHFAYRFIDEQSGLSTWNHRNVLRPLDLVYKAFWILLDVLGGLSILLLKVF